MLAFKRCGLQQYGQRRPGLEAPAASAHARSARELFDRCVFEPDVQAGFARDPTDELMGAALIDDEFRADLLGPAPRIAVGADIGVTRACVALQADLLARRGCSIDRVADHFHLSFANTHGQAVR